MPPTLTPSQPSQAVGVDLDALIIALMVLGVVILVVFTFLVFLVIREIRRSSANYQALREETLAEWRQQIVAENDRLRNDVKATVRLLNAASYGVLHPIMEPPHEE